ncbi:hypothetical protein KNO81_41540, partial [Paraburkholderia sediminicola]|nr:hypothetical protein [Paraburkholderia sediminicola]
MLHLGICGLVLRGVWFFRFCYISTGKAAELSTGYSLFRGCLLHPGETSVCSVSRGGATQQDFA